MTGAERPVDPTANDATEYAGHDLIRPGGQVDRDALLRLYEATSEEDDRPVHIRFVLSRELNKRLDRYLVDRIPFLSRTSLQRLIAESAVTVNGRAPKASTKLHRGDVVDAVLPPPPSRTLPAEPIDLDILHEDDDIVVLNKHDDIIVHPARGNQSGTIINGLAYHFEHRSSGELSNVGRDLAHPGVVHRLDRHTTGCLVCAKTETAHWRLGRQFEERTVEKRYLALVFGRLEPAADVIDIPLGKHPTQRERYAVRWDETGKASVTIYRALEIYDDFTLVEVELKTGRTHQIRVHLSHLGHALAGDDIYGGRHLTIGDVVGPGGTGERSPRDIVLGRQALHAAILGFEHPISKQRMTFQAPLPEDFKQLILLLRNYRTVERPGVAGTTIDLEAMLAV